MTFTMFRDRVDELCCRQDIRAETAVLYPRYMSPQQSGFALSLSGTWVDVILSQCSGQTVPCWHHKRTWGQGIH
jgi:hypothetical protein